MPYHEGMEQFDAIVVGAGQGGDPMARSLARSGRKTALIERRLVGGTCVNDGCTPTKTLYSSARNAAMARRGSDFGLNIPEVEARMERVQERVQGVVDDFRGGAERSLARIENLELIYGHAQFVGKRTLHVALNGGGERELAAPWLFLNPGTRSAVPPIPGLDEVPFLNNTRILELKVLPGKLLVLGGGVIGIEFAHMFRRLGSEVTVIERGPRVLPMEDEDVSDAVLSVLREDGIDVRTDSSVTAARESADRIEVQIDEGSWIEGSHLLVAVGRTPNTDDLGVDAGGVQMDPRGFIHVDEQLRTNVEGVFAFGDAKGGPAFTHIAYDDYRILEANLLNGEHRTTSARAIPYVVYLDPQLGRIGPTERALREEGVPFDSVRLDATSIARAIEMGETRGFVKAAVEKGTGRILGAAAFCYEGGELMACLQLAMAGGLTAKELNNTTFAHPSLAESLNNLFA